MANQRDIKMVDTIIGKLVHLNSKFEGNQLQEAIREVAHFKDRIQSKDVTSKKIKHK